MDERVEDFLADVLALEGEEVKPIRIWPISTR
jgi:hypothetical protein